MTNQKSPSEQALDLLLYAPLGFLTEARTILPELADRGRVQVGNARMLGRFAVTMGRQQASVHLDKVQDDARKVLESWGVLPPEVPPAAPAATAAPTGAAEPAVQGPPAAPRKAARPKATPRPAGAARGASAPAVGRLAIPDYDSLAASQVVARLAGLRPDELDAVAMYESAHRGRKTVLGKIAQLKA